MEIKTKYNIGDWVWWISIVGPIRHQIVSINISQENDSYEIRYEVPEGSFIPEDHLYQTKEEEL